MKIIVKSLTALSVVTASLMVALPAAADTFSYSCTREIFNQFGLTHTDEFTIEIDTLNNAAKFGEWDWAPILVLDNNFIIWSSFAPSGAYLSNYYLSVFSLNLQSGFFQWESVHALYEDALNSNLEDGHVEQASESKIYCN